MFEPTPELAQPLAYRIWDPARHAFFFTDGQPEPSECVDRWSGFFDKAGRPLYERDIIRVHYNWQLGWVRAAVCRDPRRGVFAAEATGPTGELLRIGFYSFADAYLVGNRRENPARLTRAREQFPELYSRALVAEPDHLPRLVPFGGELVPVGQAFDAAGLRGFSPTLKHRRAGKPASGDWTFWLWDFGCAAFLAQFQAIPSGLPNRRRLLSKVPKWKMSKLLMQAVGLQPRRLALFPGRRPGLV